MGDVISQSSRFTDAMIKEVVWEVIPEQRSVEFMEEIPLSEDRIVRAAGIVSIRQRTLRVEARITVDY